MGWFNNTWSFKARTSKPPQETTSTSNAFMWIRLQLPQTIFFCKTVARMILQQWQLQQLRVIINGHIMQETTHHITKVLPLFNPSPLHQKQFQQFHITCTLNAPTTSLSQISFRAKIWLRTVLGFLTPAQTLEMVEIKQLQWKHILLEKQSSTKLATESGLVIPSFHQPNIQPFRYTISLKLVPPR